VAVSPLIGGRTIKGPADRMLKASGFACNSLGVADSYAGLIDGLVIDHEDQAERNELEARGLEVLTTSTLMACADDKKELAKAVLAFASKVGMKEAATC